LALLFSQAKLEMLNSIVWPEIWVLTQQEIAKAHSEGFKVCVVDAAVMLKAGWDRHLHEIWVTIAPESHVSSQCT
jgi:dephospho-CoA kinase